MIKSIKKKISFKKSWEYVKEHKVEFLQLGIMLTIVVFNNDVAFAHSDINSGMTISDGLGGAFEKPMNSMMKFVTGPVPKVGATIACATGCASWAMNIENQVTKMALRTTMGAGGALGAAGLIGSVTGMLM